MIPCCGKTTQVRVRWQLLILINSYLISLNNSYKLCLPRQTMKPSSMYRCHRHLSKQPQKRLIFFHVSTFTSTIMNYHKRNNYFRDSVRLFVSKQRDKIDASKPKVQQDKVIVVIGGGASGIFASISAATTATKTEKRNDVSVKIIVLESTRDTLKKVKISGGGRCNVLHDTSLSIPTILTNGYPRGYKELKSIYYKQYTPQQMYDWFTCHGVTLKTEPDGRMFPITDTSQTIIDALLNEVNRLKTIHIWKQCTVTSIRYVSTNPTTTASIDVHHTNDDVVSDHKSSSDSSDVRDNNVRCDMFQIQYRTKSSNKDTSESNTNNERNTHESIDNNIRTLYADAVILATGSSPSGYQLAQSLGHTIIKPVPSLFTFNSAQDCSSSTGLLYGLAGVSVPYARIRFKYDSNTNDGNNNKKAKVKIIEQYGPLLITHTGLSGPSVLRLSAFGAREMALFQYQNIVLNIHWAPTLGTTEDVFEMLWKITIQNPKRIIASRCPLLIDTTTIPTVPGSNIKQAKVDPTTAAATATTTTATTTNTRYFWEEEDETDENEQSTTTTTTTTSMKTAIPKRLWVSMITKVGLLSNPSSSSNLSTTTNSMCWGDANKKSIRQLALLITDCTIVMTSKSTNKEEFVTSGGIDCSKEIDMMTMSSKKVMLQKEGNDANSRIHSASATTNHGSGLYFCGELINIDGVTGGFNFMNCWSTGYVAGTNAAQYVLHSTLSSS